MNYTIESVDIHDPAIELELRKLIRLAFKSEDLLPPGHLIKNTDSNASKPGFFLVAKENNMIIGCNGFIANDFYYMGKQYIAYQSCWTATHPDHQGKKVFINLINEAKRILKENGAAFIYGTGNDLSHPILIKKLDFSETPSMVKRIFNVPFFKSLYLTNGNIENNTSCKIDELQVKKHKALQSPDEVKIVRYQNSWAWGKLIIKMKFGLKLPVFYLGGIQLEKETDLASIFSEIFKTYKVIFIQVLSCKTNTFNVLIKKWKPSRLNGFIFYNLNMPPFKNFDIMIGAIDVF
ncbi:MAG TPA: GNAT family N-acetyltransferase [Ferruginibacter sp.]|nr:GNAT family N-acetyltransferase [Ferruginibacter sp.]